MGPRNPTSRIENWVTVAFKSVDRDDLLLRRTTDEEVHPLILGSTNALCTDSKACEGVEET